jgi:hypothetical protein
VKSSPAGILDADAHIEMARIMSDGGLVMLGVALVVTAGVLIAIGVRYLERRRLWRDRAEHLQRRLVAALNQDAALAGLAFVPEVSVDADGVANVVLTGVVPSDADRDRVVHAVRREMARLFPGASVEDAMRAERPGQRAAS